MTRTHQAPHPRREGPARRGALDRAGAEADRRHRPGRRAERRQVHPAGCADRRHAGGRATTRSPPPSPNLGVHRARRGAQARSIADLPGLIEGAHEGRGLGHPFLRHVERTRVLVAVVDGAARDPAGEWLAVEEELRLRDPALLERPMPMVVTKLDLPAVRERWPTLRQELARQGRQPLAVSAHDGTGLDDLRQRYGRARVAEARAPAPAGAPMRVHRFDAAGARLAGDRARPTPCASRAAASRPPRRGSTSRTRSPAIGSSAPWSASASTPSCAARARSPARWSASGAWSSSGATTREGRHRPAGSRWACPRYRHAAGRRQAGGAEGAAAVDARGSRTASASWVAPSTRPTSATCGWPPWPPTAWACDASCSCPPPNPRTSGGAG